MRKLVIVSIVLLIVIAIGSLYFFNFNGDTIKEQEEEEQVNVYDPATGERWDSVEAYVYRNTNRTGDKG